MCIDTDILSSVLHCVSEITSAPLPLSHELCILGVYPENTSLPRREKKMEDLCLLQARRFDCSPLEECWLSLNWPVAEKFVFGPGSREADQFYDIWGLFLHFGVVVLGDS